MSLADENYYRALTARDARFDGLFYVGVRTTGIYCRPVCTARTPGRDRCVFFSRAAEAEREGFRACFRCRPELAPGLGSVDSISRLASAAAARIDTLEDGSLDDLARELGVTARHVRRAVRSELGVSPIELAQSRRMALAKQLLQDTSLPLSEIAFASGFSSIRRFNALFLERFKRPPSALRARPKSRNDANDTIQIRLDARPPFDFARLLSFLATRAIPGVELCEGNAYRRTVRIGSHSGFISVTPREENAGVVVELPSSLVGAIAQIVARVRRLFDLDAHPRAISECLARDPLLAKSVRNRPGLRLPGAFDGFEMAMRAVLGQQVTVKAASTLAGRISNAFGDPILTPFEALSRISPSADAIFNAGVNRIARCGMPQSRAESLVRLAEAIHTGAISLDAPCVDPEKTLAEIESLRGLGEWTAHYIGMRALGWPDAFPAGDLVLKRLLGDGSIRAARARAESFRPFRAYAAIHLWTSIHEETSHE